MRLHAGLRHVEVQDPALQQSFATIVLYPTRVRSHGTRIGPYPFDATPDAPLAQAAPLDGNGGPVVVVSHGGGGSHLLYRSIATHLAEHGQIVVCLEHPGDNRRDRSLSGLDISVANRSRQASLAIDAVLTHPLFRAAADGTRIGVIGHSMGGCTALCLAGGQPWSRSGHAISVQPDPRVKAAVLMAPATDWFLAPGALDDVRCPLLVLVADKDEVTPPSRISQALGQLPAGTDVTWHVTRGAGHFSFLSPFPHDLRSPQFLPSTDPEGFDREAFHAVLPSTIQAFFSRAFAAASA